MFYLDRVVICRIVRVEHGFPLCSFSPSWCSGPSSSLNTYRPPGTEALPREIVAGTSDLELRSLCDYRDENIIKKTSKSLLAMAVGIKQKQGVNIVVEKFLASGFAVMLFHYDGWFAKRFLHPYIVAEYDYIFLWDEDLQVDNFNPTRYLSIIEDQGLEISQPGLDREKSLYHHLITIRRENSIIHRQIYKTTESLTCNKHSTNPPCTGWVEVMAPVFSKTAWRCASYMIQPYEKESSLLELERIETEFSTFNDDDNWFGCAYYHHSDPSQNI
ncbi:hypothetical protein ACFE04_022541 [Oxalis oulophora]